jgi:hypothetical protein
MKSTILLSLAALGLSVGLACADPLSDNPPKSTTICLNTGGQMIPARCQIGEASRLDAREDICICPAGAQQVKAPVCPPGVNPAPESAAVERARMQALKNGSLVGATWQGQPMCVAPRNLN